MAVKAVEMKKYLVERKNETLVVQVPATWKVTFGPVISAREYQGHSWGLRFYEGKEHQRAIFTDVVTFRDMSIDVQKRVVKVDKSAKFKSDHKGHKADESVEKEVSWVNANEIPF